MLWEAGRPHGMFAAGREAFQALRLEKGSSEPNRTKVGRLTQAQLRSIAETKMQDLNARDVEQAMLVIAGTARSMGVEVDS